MKIPRYIVFPVYHPTLVSSIQYTCVDEMYSSVETINQIFEHSVEMTLIDSFNSLIDYSLSL